MTAWIARNGPVYLVAAALAGGLKFAYSTASAADLAWILAPTAALVNALTNRGFACAGEGYVSLDERFVIVPSCAGVNFLVICYCMLVFAQTHRERHLGAKYALLLVAGGVAYLSTIGANAFRITLSIWSTEARLLVGLLTQDNVHRIEGVAIYFFALCLVYYAAEALQARRAQRIREPKWQSGTSWHSRRTLLIPLFWYLFVTLGIPALRGSYVSAPRLFLDHAVALVSIPLLISTAFSLAEWGRTRRWGPYARGALHRRRSELA